MTSDPVFLTVPWDPSAGGVEIKGRTIHAVTLAAELALAHGWSAAALRSDPRWQDVTVCGALTRTAVRWGLIP